MEIRISNLLLYFYLGVFLLIVSSMSVVAQADNRFGLKFYGSFFHSEKVPNALFFFSNIRKNDGFNLRKAMRNHEIEIIVLSSMGGSIFEGLNMAGIIHDKQLITYVPESDLESYGKCASACSFMFLAGKTRKADGKIGVHQFYSGRSNENAKIGKTQKLAQFTVSEIIGFLNEFETPPFVYEKMFQQSAMYYFDEKELIQIERFDVKIQQKHFNSINNFIADYKAENLLFKKKSNSTKLPAKAKPTTTIKKSTKRKLLKPTETKQKVIIQKVQKQLNRLNCAAGTEDGVWGSETKAALEKLNKSTNRNFSYPDILNSNIITILSSIETKNGCNRSQIKNRKSLYFQYREAFIKGKKVRNSKVISFDIRGQCGSRKIEEKWFGIERYRYRGKEFLLFAPKRPNRELIVRHIQENPFYIRKYSLYGTANLRFRKISSKLIKASGAGCNITGHKVN